MDDREMRMELFRNLVEREIVLPLTLMDRIVAIIQRDLKPQAPDWRSHCATGEELC